MEFTVYGAEKHHIFRFAGVLASFSQEQEAKQRRKQLHSGVRKKCFPKRAISVKRLSISYEELSSLSEEAIIDYGVKQGIFQEGAVEEHIAFARTCSGHGAIGVKRTMCAYVLLCHGATLAQVQLTTGLSESTVCRLRTRMLGATILILGTRPSGPTFYTWIEHLFTMARL